MKKIINRKIYNTETAEEVASWCNGVPGGEFESYAEALFLTKRGTWFLWGEGGPMTKYAECTGDSRSSGEDLIVMSPEDAYSWLEDKQALSAIQKYFSHIVKDG